ncbi:MAG TPA: sulfotransferase [Enhygromyxa sp.]|nr:sulfotransferase [Enhygromyxa sp.]
MHLLAEQPILAEAAARFGVDEPLEPTFVPAFRALLRALHEEARLSPAGAERTRERLLRAIGRRVALAQLEQASPSVTTIAIERPIVVTGFPRTGTTLLHNLLARVEGLWAPPLWQLRMPVAPVALAGDELASWEQQQRDDAAALLDSVYSAAPEFRAIHPMHPDWPDECNWLLRNCFSTLVNAFSWFVPGYVEFLRTCDMRPAYADHRRYIRALVHRHGGQPRLALKDPFHMWHVEAFLTAYPDATIISLHREPVQIVPSLASLCASLQAIDTDSPRTQSEIGRFSLYILGQGLRALEQARRTLASERFIDIPYRELLASPGAVLRSLGERLGFDASAVAVEEAGRWLEQNRQHKLGRHHYALEDFGLTAGIIEEYFEEYRARFGPLLV